MGGAGGLRNLTFAISTMRFQDNDLMVPACRNEVIEALFPTATRELHDCPLDVSLTAEAVYRYRHQRIVVIHHEVGEEHPALTFTVSIGLAPRSFDKLFDACEYIDGLLTVATDYDARLRQTGEGSLTC